MPFFVYAHDFASSILLFFHKMRFIWKVCRFLYPQWRCRRCFHWCFVPNSSPERCILLMMYRCLGLYGGPPLMRTIFTGFDCNLTERWSALMASSKVAREWKFFVKCLAPQRNEKIRQPVEIVRRHEWRVKQPEREMLAYGFFSPTNCWVRAEVASLTRLCISLRHHVSGTLSVTYKVDSAGTRDH